MDIKSLSVRNFRTSRSFLQEYARLHKKENPRWSYSIWAKRLGLKSKTPLVLVLTGKRMPSSKLVKKLVDYFKFSEVDKSYFLQLIQLEQRARVHHLNAEEIQPTEITPRDAKEVIEHPWFAFVLKELVVLLGEKADPKLLANSLPNLSAAVAESVVDCLVRIGFLVKHNSDGKISYDLSNRQVSVPWTKDSMRQFHGDSLKASERAFDDYPMEERAFRSSFVRIKKDRVAEARIKMASFQEEFIREFEDARGDDIYQQLLHFFPVTKR